MMFEKYEVLEKRQIKDLNSEGVVLRHKKTGAMVTLLLNDDENKVFYIGFRTPPEDSTGVAHIIEHSTLCGSEKYPVKDPFIELAKGSLNTFLNAMTYPDKTVYPVASCNDKDFRNLVDVYLDAVFHPNIYKEEKIFKQEGWHYEMSSPEDDLTINGVVYNEMKGVYSSPDDLVEHLIMTSLYPDNTYRLESGGFPDDIPSLTYDNFLEFHKRYYHPSNSYIYLYGNLDADEYLDYIDREYLSKYEYLKVDSEINSQNSFNEPKELVEEFPVLEDSKDKAYLSYNVSMGSALDKNLYVAIDILDYVLCVAPGAVLKKALIEAGIGDDVYSSVENGILQPYFGIIAKNAGEDNKERFVQIIEDELRKVVKEGISKKSILAAINLFEFKYREADFGQYPRGLMLGLNALDSWLYDEKNPFMHIEANETYAFLRKAVDEGYFEGLIQKYLIDNKHKTILTVKPSINMTQKKDEAFKCELQKLKASWSDEKILEIVKETEELKTYQQEPSPKEDIEKIPLLKREDLTKNAVKYINEISDIEGSTYIKHDIFTNGIGYLNLLFDVKNVPEELLRYIGILKAVLLVIDTENYNYNDLFNEVNIITGGLSVGSSSFINSKDPKDFKYCLYFKTKMLFDNIEKTFDLIEEVILRTKFDDYKRLLEIINENKVRMESSMVSAGHSVAMSRALSYFVESVAYDEELTGFPFLYLLRDLSDNFEEKKEELSNKLVALMHAIFRPENLIVDFTATGDEFEKVSSQASKLKSKLYTDSYEGNILAPVLSKKNEGFITAGQVQYVCRAGNYLDKGLEYTGALRVLHTILGYDYLWNNVRVLGGAYGCMSGFTRSGNGFMVSYRDPNLENTIDVYEKAAEYIENMELDERDITQFIIGTVSGIDIPMTPSVKASFSLRGYMTNMTDEDNQKERDQILNITEDDIHSLGKYLRAIMEDGNLCVVGSQEKIKAAEKLFMKIEQLV